MARAIFTGLDRKNTDETSIKSGTADMIKMLTSINEQLKDDTVLLSDLYYSIAASEWEDSSMQISICSKGAWSNNIDKNETLTAIAELTLSHGLKTLSFMVEAKYKLERGDNDTNRGKVFATLLRVNTSLKTKGFKVTSDVDLTPGTLDDATILDMLMSQETNNTPLERVKRAPHFILSEIETMADRSLLTTNDRFYFHLFSFNSPSMLVSGDKLGTVLHDESLNKKGLASNLVEATIYKADGGSYVAHNRFLDSNGQSMWDCSTHTSKDSLFNHYGYSDFSKALYLASGIDATCLV